MSNTPSQQILREEVLKDALLYIVEERGEEMLVLDWSVIDKLLEEPENINLGD